MRCLACDAGLTVSADNAKMRVSGERWQLCIKCYDTIRDQVDPTDNQWNNRKTHGKVCKEHALPSVRKQ